MSLYESSISTNVNNRSSNGTPRTSLKLFYPFTLLKLLVLVFACVYLSGNALTADTHNFSKHSGETQKHLTVDVMLQQNTSAHTPIASIGRACHAELESFCGSANDLPCLMKHYTTAATEALKGYSSQCREWLAARDACVGFVREHRDDLCSGTTNARECLRSVSSLLLPPRCVDSEYYRTVRLIGSLRYRARQERRKKQPHL